MKREKIFIFRKWIINNYVRLYVEAISSLSGFDDFQTSTTGTNKFCLVFYEFYILGMSLTSLQQGNTSKKCVC